MWANDVKPENPSGMWHRRALLIDTRKTILVIETESANSENPQSVADKSQLSLAVSELLLTVADLTEEPQKKSTSLSWLAQAFSPIYDLLG